MRVFIDTSAFYAVLDRDDESHERAARAWLEMLDGTSRLYTTSYVLVETTALVQHRIGMEGVRVLAADMLPVVETSWVDETVHLIALRSLLTSGRRDLSLVDCTSFEIMRRRHLTEAFCFDRHFEEQGFRLLPE